MTYKNTISLKKLNHFLVLRLFLFRISRENMLLFVKFELFFVLKQYLEKIFVSQNV